MFKISAFGLSSVFYTSCTKKEPYPFIGKTHKFKNLLNLMTLGFTTSVFSTKESDRLIKHELINTSNTFNIGHIIINFIPQDVKSIYKHIYHLRKIVLYSSTKFHDDLHNKYRYIIQSR